MASKSTFDSFFLEVILKAEHKNERKLKTFIGSNEKSSWLTLMYHLGMVLQFRPNKNLFQPSKTNACLVGKRITRILVRLVTQQRIV